MERQDTGQRTVLIHHQRGKDRTAVREKGKEIPREEKEKVRESVGIVFFFTQGDGCKNPARKEKGKGCGKATGNQYGRNKTEPTQYRRYVA